MRFRLYPWMMQRNATHRSSTEKPTKETCVYPYLLMKLGELTRLSVVVDDAHCTSSHGVTMHSL